MNALSPWLLNTNAALNQKGLNVTWQAAVNGYNYQIVQLPESLWLVANWPNGHRLAFRLAYSPNGSLEVGELTENQDTLIIEIKSVMGNQRVSLQLPTAAQAVLHWTTELTPAAPLLFPYWPRDIIPLGARSGDILAKGTIIASQVGTRSGQLYFHLTRPNTGSVLYHQNLTALEDYNQDTETSAGNTVGGVWPEIGFALPPTVKQKPLEANKTYTISDAYVVLSDEVPADEPAMIRDYLDMLATIYLAIPKPETVYHDWPETLKKGLFDLQDSPGCWSQVAGNHYFNAYLCDYKTPPEIMVQLAILLPLLDYAEWNGDQLAIMKKIKEGLPAFYLEEYGTIMRWHPKAMDKLDGEEEQKQPLVMDSWYLQHPLLNLSRLALKGDKDAKKLFLDSLQFAIKVAHHFDYQWPVFYKMDTLDVVKGETQPGKGGEKDVPGLYAHVLLQAWELTGEKKYLAEAEKAAIKLRGLGFDMFYQANNTAFSAGALLRLYKITKKQIYLELSYLAIANIFKNTQLWDCNYGYGKNLPTFFAMFPLSDAPYTAAYEEEEVFCAFHDYLRHAEDIEIEPSVRLLMAEYIRYLVHRGCYYYPPMLNKEMLSEEVKTGEVDPNLWIALEDLHDGWEKSGEVGQEVYGAGNAFGILPRHYMQIEGAGFMICTDYPTYRFSAKKHKPANFRLAGDGRLTSRLMIVKQDNYKGKLPEIKLTIDRGTELTGKKVANGNLEFEVPGDAEIHIDWR